MKKAVQVVRNTTKNTTDKEKTTMTTLVQKVSALRSAVRTTLALVLGLSIANAASAAPIVGTLTIFANGTAAVDGSGDYIGIDYGGDGFVIFPDGVLDTDLEAGNLIFSTSGSGALGSVSLPSSLATFRDFNTSGVFDGSGTMVEFNGYTLEFTSLVAVVPTAGSVLDSVDFGGYGTLTSTDPGLDATAVSWHVNANNGLIGFNIDTSGSLPSQIMAAAVPVPAAAWLFGSALLGLGAFRRK